jgi:hypothetical protein
MLYLYLPLVLLPLLNNCHRLRDGDEEEAESKGKNIVDSFTLV